MSISRVVLGSGQEIWSEAAQKAAAQPFSACMMVVAPAHYF